MLVGTSVKIAIIIVKLINYLGYVIIIKIGINRSW